MNILSKPADVEGIYDLAMTTPGSGELRPRVHIHTLCTITEDWLVMRKTLEALDIDLDSQWFDDARRQEVRAEMRLRRDLKPGYYSRNNPDGPLYYPPED